MTARIRHPQRRGKFFNDNESLYFGTDQDVSLTFDGTNMNATGNWAYTGTHTYPDDVKLWFGTGPDWSLDYDSAAGVLHFDDVGASQLQVGEGGSIRFIIDNVGNTVQVRDGYALQVYDSTDEDNINLTFEKDVAGHIESDNHIWLHSNTATYGVLIGGKDSVDGRLVIYDGSGNDFVDFVHDGTDLTATYTNTTAIKLKSAAGGEMLTFQDTGGAGQAALAYMQFEDSAGTRMGWIGYGSGANPDLTINNDNHTGDVVINAENTSGTNFEMARFNPDGDITFNGPSAFDVRILGGMGLEIFDSGSTDKMQMSHDGTDFLMTYTNTGAVRLQDPLGAEMLILQDTGGAGTASNGYISFKDSADAFTAYIGQASGGDSILRIKAHETTHSTGGVKLVAGADISVFQIFPYQTLADDATGTWTAPNSRGHGMWLVKQTWDDSGDGIFFYTGQNITTVHAGANCQINASSNPDVDGDVNIWMSSSTVMSIKNRTGVSAAFTVVNIGS
jgi:hypothetical protein